MHLFPLSASGGCLCFLALGPSSTFKTSKATYSDGSLFCLPLSLSRVLMIALAHPEKAGPSPCPQTLDFNHSCQVPFVVKVNPFSRFLGLGVDIFRGQFSRLP